MKSRRITLLAAIAPLLLIGLQAAPAAASKTRTPTASRAEVTFVNPEKFTDAADGERGSDWGRDGNLEALKEHIERRASVYIPEGQKLKVKITDVDLAGEIEPWRSPNFRDVRIVKDIYFPRIELTFQLVDATGAVIKEGTRRLSDMAFLTTIHLDRSDPLVYDKGLLDDWMRSEFAAKK